MIPYKRIVRSLAAHEPQDRAGYSNIDKPQQQNEPFGSSYPSNSPNSSSRVARPFSSDYSKEDKPPSRKGTFLSNYHSYRSRIINTFSLSASREGFSEIDDSSSSEDEISLAFTDDYDDYEISSKKATKFLQTGGTFRKTLRGGHYVVPLTIENIALVFVVASVAFLLIGFIAVDLNDTSSSSNSSSYSSPFITLPTPAPATPHTLFPPGRRELTVEDDEILFHEERDEAELWGDFLFYAEMHSKKYENEDEMSRRFGIWLDNREVLKSLNDKHGPCPLTRSKNVFGFNNFTDFDDDEVEAMFGGMSAVIRDGMLSSEEEEESSSCGFWCTLWSIITGNALIGRSVDIATPSYTWNTVPTTLDWRDFGAVSDETIQQSSCGACWAIAAVEAAESALYIHSGEWCDVCISEVVACDNSGTFGCDGGWPQNAFNFLSKKGQALWDESGKCNGEDFEELGRVLEEYDKGNVCATLTSQGGRGDADGSKPSITGYQYATAPCTCYVVGKRGCDCTNQDEELMALNVASSGPAAVCIDAYSLKSYVGGIMSGDGICSSSYEAMNHCLLVVGFHLATEDGDTSYWILKNQWGDDWGNGGYAFIEFGSNTCGIANDVTLPVVGG